MVKSCATAFSPLNCMLSKFLGESFFFDSCVVCNPLRTLHLRYKFSIVMSIYPCSVVFFIFLEVFSSLSANNRPFWSSKCSRLDCQTAIRLFRLIFSEPMSFEYWDMYLFILSTYSVYDFWVLCSLSLEPLSVQYLLRMSLSSWNSSWFCSFTFSRNNSNFRIAFTFRSIFSAFAYIHTSNPNFILAVLLMSRVNLFSRLSTQLSSRSSERKINGWFVTETYFFFLLSQLLILLATHLLLLQKRRKLYQMVLYQDILVPQL